MKKQAHYVSTLGGVGLAALLLFAAGCVAPIGADKVPMRQAYDQVEKNALRTGKPSASTIAILHRFQLDELGSKEPDRVVEQLHTKALETEERNLLYALSEMSFVAAEKIRRGVKPWDPRDARDYYLGSAVYAWLFLFGEAKGPQPGAFDRRFREACDFYNYSLGVALAGSKRTNDTIRLEDSVRRLPAGQISLRLVEVNMPLPLSQYERILLADQFRMHGLSVRNREPGLGAPLICVGAMRPQLGIRASSPATVVLRGPDSLADLANPQKTYSLEVHSSFGSPTITIGQAEVPMEIDLTTYRAYTLGQARVWKLGRLHFLAPAERFRAQLILDQPYRPDLIPVVFVHGTFSSPVTWAEMANSLTSDPVLRQGCQYWSFIYGSGNPLVQSVADLRAALTEKVEELDPAGTNTLLRQMVVIGHSQGGLLTKGTAIDAGDRLWQVFSTNRIEQLNVDAQRREELRRYLFLEPLPFVKRVVFVATPHRGSYLAGSFVRRLGHRLVTLPSEIVSRGGDVLKLAEGSEVGEFLSGRLPTSLDGMSPKNPGLIAMADIPVAPEIEAHSIIPVKGEGDYREGKDGLVAYTSAHLEGVKSEYIVRSKHSCLNHPATVEEVRRILHEHLLSTR